MDRDGQSWTGDDIDTAAQGEAAQPRGSDNRADDRAGGEAAAPRQRSVDTAAAESVRSNDDG